MINDFNPMDGDTEVLRMEYNKMVTRIRTELERLEEEMKKTHFQNDRVNARYWGLKWALGEKEKTG